MKGTSRFQIFRLGSNSLITIVRRNFCPNNVRNNMSLDNNNGLTLITGIKSSRGHLMKHGNRKPSGPIFIMKLLCHHLNRPEGPRPVTTRRRKRILTTFTNMNHTRNIKVFNTGLRGVPSFGTSNTLRNLTKIIRDTVTHHHLTRVGNSFKRNRLLTPINPRSIRTQFIKTYSGTLRIGNNNVRRPRGLKF